VSVSTSKEPARIAGMFDAIARRYDTLNHLLSAGLDRGWRRAAIRALALTERDRVLDVCTGTADLAIAAASDRVAHAGRVVGVDFAGEMLRLGLAKVRAAGLGRRISLVRGDATALPLPDASFDAVTIAFGIRNVVDPRQACREFHRVLRPGGRLAVLEFGLPRLPGVRQLYAWYINRVLPRIGALISRHQDAYAYLPASVAEFPSDEGFAAWLRDAGLSQVRYRPLALGSVYLYTARKS
jgi:demethylmenaquinone methyltransferase/2-methoxy-6-polyprenyl-1,4-benzoquinol methylase